MRSPTDAPFSITILEGAVSGPATLMAGSATLPCSTTVTVEAENLVSDSVSVTVNPDVGITMEGLPATVGAGLVSRT